MGQRIPSASPGSQLPASCQRCSLSNLCIPLAVDPDHMGELDRLVNQGRTIGRGTQIFRQHAPFHAFYAVRSGAVKTCIVNDQGDEQITGFYLPGEIVGLDSVGADNVYACSAKALEHSSVCEIPFAQLETLATQIPSLQHHFFHLMSQEIQGSQQLSMLLSKSTSEERLASLILSLSSRYFRRRLSPNQFRLPMARNDIANYLGLAVETVSRVLTRFQQQGLIRLDGRELHILDKRELQTILVKPQLCAGNE